MQQTLADANPSVPRFRSDLANTYQEMGGVLRQTKRPVEALTSFEKARGILQMLVDVDPNDTESKSDLATSHYSVGVMLAQMAQPADALAEYEKASAIQSELVNANPDVTQYQMGLAISLAEIGNAHQLEGRLIKAVQAYRKATAILGRLPTLEASDRYNLACFHVRLAELAERPGSGLSAADGQAEADHALHWLKNAVDAGYHDLAWMQADPDLNFLRMRPDFQHLLLDLSMPVEPFAVPIQTTKPTRSNQLGPLAR